ncbi:hypothetical protein [Nocardia nova]|uniref:hypothetical protein n=1 Tax=Nocardia nova TaxID=37330 RepID=UPI00340F2D75
MNWNTTGFADRLAVLAVARHVASCGWVTVPSEQPASCSLPEVSVRHDDLPIDEASQVLSRPDQAWTGPLG